MKIAYSTLHPMPSQVQIKEKQINREQIVQNKVAEVLDKQTQTEEYKYYKNLGSRIDVYA